MARLPKSIRINRLVELLRPNQHYQTAEKLAQELKVTERTFYRDLGALSNLGYSVYHDRGYKLHKTMPPVKASLSPEDLQTLRLLTDTSSLHKLPEVKQRCIILFSKLENIVPVETDETDETMICTGDGLSPDQLKISLKKIEAALSKKSVCQVSYQGLKDNKPLERTIHPYGLTIRAGNWYLVAFDEERNDFRTFRLERIFKLKVEQVTFKRDDRFNLDNYFANSWAVFRGKPTKVKILLKGIAAKIATERNWPKDREIEWQDDNTAILTATVNGTEEIMAWVMSLGSDAELLAPKLLKNQLIKALQRTLAGYEKLG
ncbi:MAG: transcriptional regulator [Candidatus Hinthialibacter antarcticus]|nr:transcriptional regulator [Candidatus Hinthialibacter antarcticus]